MRRAVVLLMTLAAVIVIGTLVTVLVAVDSRFKSNLQKEAAYVQGTLFLRDMSEYLLANPLTPEEIFGGSGIPVSMALDHLEGSVTLYSAQRKIDLNAYLKHLTKNQQAYSAFLHWLNTAGFKKPDFMLALLLDTLDKDTRERMSGSEIRLEYPQFQNGALYPQRTLPAVLRTYRQNTGDTNATVDAFGEVFGFEPLPFDLNYATLDQLLLLYPDLPRDQLARIAAHDQYYKKKEELPLPPGLRQSVLQPRFGITPTLKTDILEAVIDYTYAKQWQARLSFRLSLGKKPKIYFIRFSPLAPLNQSKGEQP